MSRRGKSQQTLETSFQILRDNPKLRLEVHSVIQPEIPEDIRERVIWTQPNNEKEVQEMKFKSIL